MTIRSPREPVTFKYPFRIRGIERLLPAGAYQVTTDEQTIEGLTLAAYPRIATMLMVPAEGAGGFHGDGLDPLGRPCQRCGCERRQ